MRVDWKAHINTMKKVIFFLMGGFFLTSISTVIFYQVLSPWLAEVDENEIRELLANPLDGIAKMTSKLFFITYILFYTLPNKIRKANLWLRPIYFTLFYIFCMMVYLWI